MSETVRPLRGRPRKHESTADRIKAFRVRRNLAKATVDVPTPLLRHFLDYAKELQKLNPKEIELELSIHSLTWNVYTEFDLCYCDWLQGRLRAEIKYLPRKKAFGWQVFDAGHAPPEILAGGAATSLTKAKSICETVFPLYNRSAKARP